MSNTESPDPTTPSGGDKAEVATPEVVPVPQEADTAPDLSAEVGDDSDDDEAVLGESSLAAPISDHAGHTVGAIAVVGETRRILPRGPAKGLQDALADAARSISREFGAPRWPAASE